mgnify:FL=1
MDRYEKASPMIKVSNVITGLAYLYILILKIKSNTKIKLLECESLTQDLF